VLGGVGAYLNYRHRLTRINTIANAHQSLLCSNRIYPGIFFMYIEEVILDGFKSYATETRIERFDTQFNAVTGQNGSGKSNIVDAICFVLGISNLSKVRVSYLSDLVYKSGQAGITKASVTIILNNEDKNSGRTPVGYESFSRIEVCRQIVIGGRNRYLINGQNVQQQQVQNLFHSVQLNVNNPHFLIMQGSITRVINMKPREILGLIEEAAGTKMYENKKVQARKLVEKNHGTFKMIDKLILSEISPALERLRKDKQLFDQWLNLSKDLKSIDKYLIGYDFCQLSEILDPGRLTVLQERHSSLAAEIEKLKIQHSETTKSLEKLSSVNSPQILTEYQEDEKKCRSELLSTETQLKSKQKLADSLAAKLAKLQKEIEKTQSQLARKRPEAEAAVNKAEEAKDELDRLEETREAIINGQSRSGESRLYSEIKFVKEEIASVKSQEDALIIRLKGLEQTVITIAGSADRADRDRLRLAAEKQSIESKIAEAASRLNALNFSEAKYSEVQSNVRNLEGSVRDQENLLREAEGNIRAQYFVTPDHQVKGAIATLFKVKPDYEKYVTALEVVGSGKLANYVIDTSVHAAERIEETNGRGGRKATYLPLDELQYKKIDERQKRVAREIAHSFGGEAALAIDALNFEESVRPAIEFVFSGAFLCTSRQIAEKVCFHPEIRSRTVTIEGDSFDPYGAISGGAAKGFAHVRLNMKNYQLRDSLKFSREKYAAASGELNRLMDGKRSFDEKSLEIVRFKRELATVEGKLGSISSQRETDSMKETEAQVKEIRQKIEVLRETRRNLDAKIALFNSQLTSLGSVPGETEADKKKRDIANLERQIKEQIAETKTQRLAAQNLQNEIVSLDDDTKTTRESIAATLTDQSVTLSDLSQLQEIFEKRKLDLQKSTDALDKAREKTQAANLGFLNISKLQSTLKIRKEGVESEALRIKTKIAQVQAESKDAKTKFDRLMKHHPWIAAEKEDFYYGDATAESIATKRAELQDMRQEEEKQVRQVNKNAASMLTKAEKECSELQNKRSSLEKEKEDIDNFIEDLDDKKGKALARTCQVVNQSFSAIFRSLLPNVDAKLEPPEGKSAIEGLELRVAFGDVWKDSLTELSGGQKSLLALSLILALLRYKPAPFYILDEVDAALDDSHTTNIGQMIKTHFPDSQFIIVSLKDGMFNNANVLFRTRFEDGTSKVTRIQQSSGLVTDEQPKKEKAVSRKRRPFEGNLPV